MPKRKWCENPKESDGAGGCDGRRRCRIASFLCYISSLISTPLPGLISREFMVLGRGLRPSGALAPFLHSHSRHARLIDNGTTRLDMMETGISQGVGNRER